MDGQPAPESVLDLLACTCSRSCQPNKCECIKSGIKCTEMCKLAHCENQAQNVDDDLVIEPDLDYDLDD